MEENRNEGTKKLQMQGGMSSVVVALIIAVAAIVCVTIASNGFVRYKTGAAVTD